MTLVEFIKKETNLSNVDIVKRCITVSSMRAIYNLLNGRTEPNFCTVFKIFKALNISPEKVAEFYKQYKY